MSLFHFMQPAMFTASLHWSGSLRTPSLANAWQSVEASWGPQWNQRLGLLDGSEDCFDCCWLFVKSFARVVKIAFFGWHHSFVVSCSLSLHYACFSNKTANDCQICKDVVFACLILDPIILLFFANWGQVPSNVPCQCFRQKRLCLHWCKQHWQQMICDLTADPGTGSFAVFGLRFMVPGWHSAVRTMGH